ncbi:hypothetical protein [Burkholderia cepacia]|nr:hypothetical protein [Burkholderia cepacia]
MNKLNAARRHANDCPEEIFLEKVPEPDGAGYRRTGRWFADRPPGVGDG